MKVVLVCKCFISIHNFHFFVPIFIMLFFLPLEVIYYSTQGFITDNERALEELFVDEEDSRKGDACLNVMASRIATVFASLRVSIMASKC